MIRPISKEWADTGRLTQMVRSRLNKWAHGDGEEGITIRFSIHTTISDSRVFPLGVIPFRNEDCETMVILSEWKDEERGKGEREEASFMIQLTCRQGFVVSASLADALANQVSVDMDDIIDQKEYGGDDVS